MIRSWDLTGLTVCDYLGTKALSKAYETSSGQHRKDSMMNVHYGFKECSKVSKLMCLRRQ